MGALIQWIDDQGLWSKLDVHYTDEEVEVLGGLQGQMGELDTQEFRDLCHWWNLLSVIGFLSPETADRLRGVKPVTGR